MKVTVNCIAFTKTDIPADLLKEFDAGGNFEGVWVKKIADELNARSSEEFDCIVNTEDIYEAIAQAKEELKND